MPRRKFTQEQVDALSKNPYTLSVSPSEIKFTNEFKDILWNAYTGTKNYVQVFRNHGYDPEVLGQARIYNTVNKVAKKHQEAFDLCDQRAQDNRSMEERIKILEFELSAVKKILQLTQTTSEGPR